MSIPNGDRIDKFFDVDQRKAIAAALDDSRAFMVIHGPRGSGKTLVAAEIINHVNYFVVKNKNIKKMRILRSNE